jgi:hypothetical protein
MFLVRAPVALTRTPADGVRPALLVWAVAPQFSHAHGWWQIVGRPSSGRRARLHLHAAATTALSACRASR